MTACILAQKDINANGGNSFAEWSAVILRAGTN